MSDRRQKTGRVCRPLYDDALNGRCFDMMAQMLLLVNVVQNSDSRIPKVVRQASLPPQTGMVKNSITAGSEHENLPCLRASLLGTRFVVAVLHSDLAKFLTKYVERGEQPILTTAAGLTPEWFKNYMTEIISEEVKAMAKAVTAFCGTVGPGDIMYVPAGHWIWEEALQH